MLYIRWTNWQKYAVHFYTKNISTRMVKWDCIIRITLDFTPFRRQKKTIIPFVSRFSPMSSWIQCLLKDIGEIYFLGEGRKGCFINIPEWLKSRYYMKTRRFLFLCKVWGNFLYDTRYSVVLYFFSPVCISFSSKVSFEVNCGPTQVREKVWGIRI